ncbi:hypothetical protein LY78DRAFT_656781 [Colletotrichum sublineola]|nr:hypothetical protein LY78DRAFT_656781 [Colletotrichum sublineola]
MGWSGCLARLDSGLQRVLFPSNPKSPPPFVVSYFCATLIVVRATRHLLVTTCLHWYPPAPCPPELCAVHVHNLHKGSLSLSLSLSKPRVWKLSASSGAEDKSVTMDGRVQGATAMATLPCFEVAM